MTSTRARPDTPHTLYCVPLISTIAYTGRGLTGTGPSKRPTTVKRAASPRRRAASAATGGGAVVVVEDEDDGPAAAKEAVRAQAAVLGAARPGHTAKRAAAARHIFVSYSMGSVCLPHHYR